MGKSPSRSTILAFVAAMVITDVMVDVLFFRGQAWERFIANVSILALFGAIYMGFVRPK